MNYVFPYFLLMRPCKIADGVLTCHLRRYICITAWYREMKHKKKDASISKNIEPNTGLTTDFEQSRTQNWFKTSRADVIKLHGLLPKSWLQRIYFYELFLIIGELDGDPQYGITDYFEMIETRNCTTKTLSTFLSDRIADGDIVSVQSLKQSRKTYRLNPDLKRICESLVLETSTGSSSTKSLHNTE